MIRRSTLLILLAVMVGTIHASEATDPTQPHAVAGIYPSLTMYNNEGECGTGAVVPWAGRLWAITYAPHRPLGSSDKLYEITPDLTQIIRPESIGGTPANRLIHRESNQLNIGPYFISQSGEVRTVSYTSMPGRHTGTARHLSDPEHKIHIATMEQGLYSIDVNTLDVTLHIKDRGNFMKGKPGLDTAIPGVHGKGLYSGQGQLFYSNNGEKGKVARVDPTITAGALASWDGDGDWDLVRRAQFTEITGPGGIYGNSKKDDPVWALGWDERSLILMTHYGNEWYSYRLPKGSHSYDGAHGWNTEWPRIREIGEDDLLATMHGTFWRFPASFAPDNTAGIRPRSNYLKVIGDFAVWQDRLVLGCDDSAQKEFLNTRSFKGHAAPLQSNSNLWFIDPADLDHIGPVIGRGSVWLRDDVKAGAISEPYLFAGYDHRTLAITHSSPEPKVVILDIDHDGSGDWEEYQRFEVTGSVIHQFDSGTAGEWIRVRIPEAISELSVHFNYRNRDNRSSANSDVFAALTRIDELDQMATAGWIRSTNQVLSLATDDSTFYALNDQLEWGSNSVSKIAEVMAKAKDNPTTGISVDAASIIITEDKRTFRLPKNDAFNELKDVRICREVATERDLLNLHGTFYELPARNAQGVAKIRPIATHNLAIRDYGSHFGLLFLTGLTSMDHERVYRSEDSQAAVWAGAIDELWQLGKPRGEGGPWKNSAVTAHAPSDAYLITGYDRKTVAITTDVDTTITLEIDIDGTGLWIPYQTFTTSAGETLTYTFPEGFSAYWVRARATNDCTATAWFTYD